MKLGNGNLCILLRWQVWQGHEEEKVQDDLLKLRTLWIRHWWAWLNLICHVW